jgi:WD40 repeat protein
MRPVLIMRPSVLSATAGWVDFDISVHLVLAFAWEYRLTFLQEINDLATSPSDPSIIASASDDTTVRVWGLSAIHAKQPCLALLGGESHRAALLSVVCGRR